MGHYRKQEDFNKGSFPCYLKNYMDEDKRSEALGQAKSNWEMS